MLMFYVAVKHMVHFFYHWDYEVGVTAIECQANEERRAKKPSCKPKIHRPKAGHDSTLIHAKVFAAAIKVKMTHQH